MKWIIACEESGVVRDAFLRAGHYAISCDLLPSLSPHGDHYQGNVLDIIGMGWDGMIAHPSCTYLSSSGLHWNRNPKSPRFGGAQTEEALDFVRQLLAAPIKHKAIENPIGCIGTRIRAASQTIQPYEYGDDASKATCLWLENLPLLVPDPRMRVPGRWVQHKGKLVERWANQTDSGQNKLAPSADRWKIRSRTYDGIANAFVAQWGKLSY